MLLAWSDHPRSRGVYATTTWTAVIIPGSSPLARGLHGHPGDGDGGARIIPARAGFTGRDSVTSTGTWDHPRSRGVYVAHDRNVMGTVGSSPLARGLRDYRIACVRDGRIIPARAGFTRRCVSRWPAPWDHPRSRGVYDSGPRTGAGSYGSSPLARGLPLEPLAWEGHSRIIPARAGFTQ